MGMFDSILVTCPMCGDRDEIQTKPCVVEGEMGQWDISEAPEKALYHAAYMPEYCGCGCVYQVVENPAGEGYCLRVGRDIPISELPKRVEWVEKAST